MPKGVYERKPRSTMPVVLEVRTFPIWAAIGPRGQIVKDSVGINRSRAERLAIRRNFALKRIAELRYEVPVPVVPAVPVIGSQVA